MISLVDGARRANFIDQGEYETVIEALPSGRGAAVFEDLDRPENEWAAVVLNGSSWREEDKPWNFNLHMEFWDGEWKWYYDSFTSVPRDDKATALRVEEEWTSAFNRLVREIKAGGNYKSIAEHYGFDQVDKDWPE